MPLEQLPNNDDRYFVPVQPTVSTAQAAKYESLRSAAAVAINNYFSDLQTFRCFKHITIDDFISNCFKLSAVKEYINAEPDELESVNSFNLINMNNIIRVRNIKIHIVLKIKEYIDGKL
jgi:hypothetical protein